MFVKFVVTFSAVLQLPQMLYIILLRIKYDVKIKILRYLLVLQIKRLFQFVFEQVYFTILDLWKAYSINKLALKNEWNQPNITKCPGDLATVLTLCITPFCNLTCAHKIHTRANGTDVFRPVPSSSCVVSQTPQEPGNRTETNTCAGEGARGGRRRKRSQLLACTYIYCCV